jgi:type II secretory pathway pseudopilin PulG
MTCALSRPTGNRKMKLLPQRRRCHGLTLLELLLIVVALAILVGLLLPGFPGTRGKAPSTVCVVNLKQLTLAELVWANDHGRESLPAQLSTNVSGLREIALSRDLTGYYKAISNELASPRILSCPSSRRGCVDEFVDLTTNHLSYFLNADATLSTNYSTVLHGDRQIEFTPPARGAIVRLGPDTAPRWTKGIHYKDDQDGNIAHTDGSVQRTSSGAEIRDVFHSSIQAGHRLVFP